MGLETVELVIAWEKEFSISIPNDLAATLATPAHAVIAIERLLSDEGRMIERSAIASVIKVSTLRISGIKDGDYSPDGRFVQDFGMD